MKDESSLQPVVIDNGSQCLKAGFAGADRPQCIFGAAVGRPKYQHANSLRVYGGKLEGSDYFVGRKVQEHRGFLKITYPIDHGVVSNWDDVEKLWVHVYESLR